jgi:ankyrin repeat protein
MLVGAISESRTKCAERLAIIDCLIEAGAEVNAHRGGNTSTRTPLMMAVAQGDQEIASRLIAAGAEAKNEAATNS